MDSGLVSGLGDAVGLIARTGESVAVSPPGRGGIAETARRILEVESPRRIDTHLQAVIDHVQGLGPLQGLLDQPETSDVLVNGPHDVWVDTSSGLKQTDVAFPDSDAIVALVERLIAPLGLRIDRSSPTVDARLADGSRLHAVLPPASVDFPLLAIRRFRPTVAGLEDLVELGSASSEQIHRLRTAVQERRTILVSGGTGTGKTTLLNLLSAVIPADERTVVVEDASELSLSGHVVRLEARPPNTEGAGEISIRSLMRSSLRLRPDRIILGEVRGPEAFDLVTALNTGHRGSMTTIHANSPREAMWRLETLAMSAGIATPDVIQRQLGAAVDVIVQLERVGPARRISEVSSTSEHSWKF